MDADCLLRGRRDAFGTSGSICVAGVALSVPSWMSAEACGDDGGPMDADGLLMVPEISRLQVATCLL